MRTTRSEFRSVCEIRLYVALELGSREWKLALTTGYERRPVVRTVPAGEVAAVRRVVAQTRHRWGLAAAVPVVSCYEAGRDGFWVHRAVTAEGWMNCVVDSSSIEVNRRARRTKTDRLDAVKLVLMLVRAVAGDGLVWRTVQVPSEAAEAARHRSRERTALTKERTRLRNQITSWLATCGCRVGPRRRQAVGWWATVRDWRDAALPPPVQDRLARADARLRVVQEQIAALEAAQAAAVQTAPATSALRQLVQLKGVATTSASVLLDEGLVWRGFRNRREIGGLLGFAPAQYTSGARARDQGISRAGNAPLQGVAIQLAWNWVRWQPTSAITRWYRAHFGDRQRSRRIGIVAVARRVVIALWRYVTAGIVPAGAQFTAVSR